MQWLVFIVLLLSAPTLARVPEDRPWFTFEPTPTATAVLVRPTRTQKPAAVFAPVSCLGGLTDPAMLRGCATGYELDTHVYFCRPTRAWSGSASAVTCQGRQADASREQRADATIQSPSGALAVRGDPLKADAQTTLSVQRADTAIALHLTATYATEVSSELVSVQLFHQLGGARSRPDSLVFEDVRDGVARLVVAWEIMPGRGVHTFAAGVVMFSGTTGRIALTLVPEFLNGPQMLTPTPTPTARPTPTNTTFVEIPDGSGRG